MFIINHYKQLTSLKNEEKNIIFFPTQNNIVGFKKKYGNQE